MTLDIITVWRVLLSLMGEMDDVALSLPDVDATAVLRGTRELRRLAALRLQEADEDRRREEERR